MAHCSPANWLTNHKRIHHLRDVFHWWYISVFIPPVRTAWSRMTRMCLITQILQAMRCSSFPLFHSWDSSNSCNSWYLIGSAITNDTNMPNNTNNSSDAVLWFPFIPFMRFEQFVQFVMSLEAVWTTLPEKRDHEWHECAEWHECYNCCSLAMRCSVSLCCYSWDS